MLYSTSAYEAQMQFHGDDMYYFRRQALIGPATILGAAYISRWDYHALIPVFQLLAYFVALVLMAMVKWTPFGVEVFGTRWLKLGIQFQPSEESEDRSHYLSSCSDHQDGETDQNLEGCFVLLGLGGLQALGGELLSLPIT